MDDERLAGEILRRGWLSAAHLAEARDRAQGRGRPLWAEVLELLQPEQLRTLRSLPPRDHSNEIQPGAPAGAQGGSRPGSSAGSRTGSQIGRLPPLGSWLTERYQVLRRLGQGAMGAVYVARDAKTGQEIALKVQHGGGQDAQARFRIEGKALAKLRHPGVVEVRDFGMSASGCPYLAMELVRGRTLAEEISARGHLPPRRAVEIALQIARALAHVHAAGVLHRDLKPDNILLTPDGRVVLTDFGVAKIVDQDRHLSQTGQLLGTPAYMAPELVSGRVREVGPASEVYALGATLYDMLTGRPPFTSSGHYELLIAVLDSRPEPPSSHQDSIPRGLDALCLRCLAKEASERYPDMATLIPELEEATAGGQVLARTSPRRRSQTALVLVLLALLATFGGWLGAGLLGSGPSASLGPSPDTTPAGPSAPRLSWIDPPRSYLFLDQELRVGYQGAERPRVLLGRILEAQEGLSADPSADPSRVRTLTLGSSSLRVLSLWEGELQAKAATSLDLSLAALEALGPEPRQIEVVCVALDPQAQVWGEPIRLTLALAPEWLVRLPPHERPPRLPPGLVPSDTIGRYVNEPEGSVLTWIPPGPVTLFAGHLATSRRLEEGVFLGRSEVTWSQLNRFLKERRLAPRGEEQPPRASASVDWFMAQEYCRWAGARLPSEVEWSRAAWGNQPSWAQAVQSWRRLAKQPREGDQASPTAFGSLDMLGNLRELTRDPFHDLGQKVSSPLKLPPGDLGRVVLLGGAWDVPPGRGDLKLMSTKPTGFRICVDARGRTRDLSDQRWTVSLGQFEPPGEGEAGSGSWPAPLPHQIRRLGSEGGQKKTWSLRRLEEPWPFTDLARRELQSEVLEGFYLQATSEVTLQPGAFAVGAWSDDGLRVTLRRGGDPPRVLLERWNTHLPTFDWARFEVEGEAACTIEVDYCNVAGGRSLRLALYPN